MVNKLNIPVHIISLHNKLEFDFNKYFNNVTIFPAIDSRGKKVRDYYDDGTITFRTMYDILNGRKDHHAFSGIGGIGLYLSYKKLIKQLQNSTQNILICEEDCFFTNIKSFARKLKLLKNKEFDCAVFGSDFHSINMFKQENFSDFIDSKENFYFAHSIVWSPSGIKKILPYLEKPIEVQLDSLFSSLYNNNKLNVLIEKNKTTIQAQHKSYLKNDRLCKLCDYDAKSNKYNFNIWIEIRIWIIYIAITLIILLILFIIFIKIRGKN